MALAVAPIGYYRGGEHLAVSEAVADMAAATDLLVPCLRRAVFQPCISLKTRIPPASIFVHL